MTGTGSSGSSGVLVVDASVWVAAFDPTDVHHARSVDFLRAVEEAAIPLSVPAFAIVEVACAITRRTGSGPTASDATRAIMSHPLLTVEPMSAELLAAATDAGITRQLRGGDALYVATMQVVSGRLVAWDRELLARGDAIEPSAWLDHPPGGRQAGTTSTTAL